MAEKQHAVNSNPAKSARSEIGGVFADALGFQRTGIASQSVAARLMASYGGTVPAGSLCSTLQSVGASRPSAGASVTAAGRLAPSSNPAKGQSICSSSVSAWCSTSSLQLVCVGGQGGKSESTVVGKSSGRAHVARSVGSGGPSHQSNIRISVQCLGGGPVGRSQGSSHTRVAARVTGHGSVPGSGKLQSSHSRSAAPSRSSGNMKR